MRAGGGATGDGRPSGGRTRFPAFLRPLMRCLSVTVQELASGNVRPGASTTAAASSSGAANSQPSSSAPIPYARDVLTVIQPGSSPVAIAIASPAPPRAATMPLVDPSSAAATDRPSSSLTAAVVRSAPSPAISLFWKNPSPGAVTLIHPAISSRAEASPLVHGRVLIVDSCETRRARLANIARALNPRLLVDEFEVYDRRMPKILPYDYDLALVRSAPLDTDGDAVVWFLRKETKVVCPIIVLSLLHRGETAHFFASGATEFIDGPFGIDDMRRTLDKYYLGSDSSSEPETAAATGERVSEEEQANPATAALDLAKRFSPIPQPAWLP